MAAPPPGARLASVNVGEARTVEWMGRSVTTAIWKSPVDGEVAVAGVNLAGDEQADRRVHGGADKAVYAYALEDYRWWSDLLGVEVGAGTFGENLTTGPDPVRRTSAIRGVAPERMSTMETMGRTKRLRRSFTREFKAEVVALVRQPGNTAASVARDLDLTETAVRDWVKQADIDDREA
jgi:hypothetical protein